MYVLCPYTVRNIAINKTKKKLCWFLILVVPSPVFHHGGKLCFLCESTDQLGKLYAKRKTVSGLRASINSSLAEHDALS